MSDSELNKAINQVKEYYDTQLRELKDGIKQTHDDYVRVPTLLDRAIVDLKEYYDVKIKGIKNLLEEKINGEAKRSRDLDTAREQALNHALLAARELVAVANQNFTRQIESSQSDFRNQISSLDVRVNDLKDNLTRLSSTTQGGMNENLRRRADTGSYSAIVMALVAALGVAITIGTIVLTRPSVPATIYLPDSKR